MGRLIFFFLLSIVLLPLIIFLVLSQTAYRQHAASDLNAAISHDYAFSATQLTNTANTLGKTSYPDYTTSSGSWGTSGASGWTSGFFPGALWLMYEKTGDTLWRTRAESWTAGLEGQKNNTSTHDVGFIMFSSFGNGYRLTQNASYKAILLTAAGSLATRYSPVVKAIKSWNGGSTDYQVIIDNMMNLELLFWAAKNGGQQSWYDIAYNHALTTMNNHIRPDGSVYQLVNFNPTTGAVQLKTNKQGYNSSSTWSRGQAWAIHGFTIAYRETKEQRFLDTARKTADYFINHLPPDAIPFWDFQAPNIPNEPKDTSAAAITASGLLELSSLETDPTRKQIYATSAQNILASLSSNSYLAEGTSNKAILLHGTGNKPSGNFDTGVIYGDYYFLQALLRFERLTGVVPTIPVTQSISPTHPNTTNTPVPPSQTPKPPTQTPKPQITAILSPLPASLSIQAALHGIGTGGDNVNPNATGTQNPVTQTITITIDVFGSTNQLVKSTTGGLQYDKNLGMYKGIVAIESVPTGLYTLQVTVPKYLPKRLVTIVSLQTGQTTTLAPFRLIAGDANVDGKLSVLDYNVILDCFSDLTLAKNCSDPVKKKHADTTDDGNVNQFDYNLFLRELSVQPGQ